MSKKICPICGYQDDGNATYCRECGAKLTECADDAWSSYEQKGQYSSYQDNGQQAYGGTGQQSTQYTNYQDYTANIPYQQSANDFGSDNTTRLPGLCAVSWPYAPAAVTAFRL